jgi:hypothetical protein
MNLKKRGLTLEVDIWGAGSREFSPDVFHAKFNIVFKAQEQRMQF